MNDSRGQEPANHGGNEDIPPKGPLWKAPGFWIAAFFVLLITMNVIFFWIAGSNPPEIIYK